MDVVGRRDIVVSLFAMQAKGYPFSSPPSLVSSKPMKTSRALAILPNR
jgi:hypothetical protein